MAAKYTENPETLLKCPNCLTKMTEPRAFQCFHLFCQPCIHDMKPKEGESVPSYECPICQKITQKDDVQPMTFIHELLKVVTSAKTEPIKCDKCNSKIPTHRCLDCKQTFCSACRTAHNEWAMLAHHTWRELSDPSHPVYDQHVYCTQHPQELVKLHCRDCKQLLCHICSGTEHKTHHAETIDEAFLYVKPIIKDNKDKVEQTIKEKEKLLAHTTLQGEETKKKYEDIEKEIDRKCEEVMKTAREDCKKLKDQLETKKNKEFSDIENYRKQLEKEIQGQKNLVALSDITLSTAQGTSFLQTVHTGIMGSLDFHAEEPILSRPYVSRQTNKFLETTNLPNNLLDNIIPIYSSTRIKVRLADVSKLSGTLTTQTRLPGSCTKFIKMGNEMWCTQENTNTIHVSDIDGTHLRTITYGSLHQCHSIEQSGRDIFIAASNGLCSVDLNGQVIQTILNKNTCDVSVLGDLLFVLSGEERKVYIIKVNGNEKTYSVKSTFDIENYNADNRNTILATEGYVYVAQFMGEEIIQQYSHSGYLHSSFTSVRNPRLCGVDEDGSLLILRQGVDYRIATLTIKGAWGQLSVTGLSSPSYAIIEGDRLWVAYSGKQLDQYVLK